MKSAKQSDWRTTSLPSKRTSILLNRLFSLHEIQLMKVGHVPQEMEDKWIVYWQGDTLFFHRSWTGFCIYGVRFAAEVDSYRMVGADVNRDSEQYGRTNDDYDAKVIEYLIDALLLKQKADFPRRAELIIDVREKSAPLTVRTSDCAVTPGYSIVIPEETVARVNLGRKDEDEWLDPEVHDE